MVFAGFINVPIQAHYLSSSTLPSASFPVCLVFLFFRLSLFSSFFVLGLSSVGYGRLGGAGPGQAGAGMGQAVPGAPAPLPGSPGFLGNNPLLWAPGQGRNQDR